jgi:hypothetical protein
MPAAQRRPEPPVLEAVPSPAANPFDFDEPGIPGAGGYAPRELPPGWGTVRVGLALMSWGVLLGLLTIVLVGCTTALTEPGGGRQKESPLVALSMAPALVAGPLLLVGMGLCLATPSTSGAQGMAIAAFVMLFCFSAIGAILFLLFLRDVATYFRNKALAKQIIFFLCCAVGVPLLSCCVMGPVRDAFVIKGEGQEVGPALLNAVFALPFLGLVLWLWYLLRATRASISAERHWGKAAV